MLKTGNRRLTRNAGTVARKATRRESAGRNVPIQKNPDPARSSKGSGKGRTMPMSYSEATDWCHRDSALASITTKHPDLVR